MGYWLDRARLEAAPEPKKALFREAGASVGPYREAGRLRTFAENADPIPGFKSIWRPGHTPGHSSIVVESKGEKLVVWGDITHGDVIQFDEPDIGISFDEDSPAAAIARRAAFAEAAEQRYWVAGAHIAFPGIGHVRWAGSGPPARCSVPVRAGIGFVSRETSTNRPERRWLELAPPQGERRRALIPSARTP